MTDYFLIIFTRRPCSCGLPLLPLVYLAQFTIAQYCCAGMKYKLKIPAKILAKDELERVIAS
jgi:hypothetical protein